MAQWARHKRRQQVVSLQELAWIHQEEIEMGDDEKSAYRCQVKDDRLQTVYEPTTPDNCTSLKDAVEILQKAGDDSILVIHNDMGKLRSQLASFGIG